MIERRLIMTQEAQKTIQYLKAHYWDKDNLFDILDIMRQIIEKQQLKIVKLEEEVHSLNTHRKVIENDMHILFNKITEKENNII